MNAIADMTAAAAELDTAAALANTRALTVKKNALADEELARGYRDRFVAELESLGGKRLPIEPIPLQEGKGKVSFSLGFNGAKSTFGLAQDNASQYSGWTTTGSWTRATRARESCTSRSRAAIQKFR